MIVDLALGVVRMQLTRLATLVCGATGVFAHCGVRVVYQFIVLRAVVA